MPVLKAAGIGGSILGPDDPMGINLGIAVLLGIVLAAIAAFRLGLSRGRIHCPPPPVGVCRRAGGDDLEAPAWQ